MVGVHGGSAWAAYEVIEVAGVVRGCRGCPDLLIGVKRWVAGKVFRQGWPDSAGVAGEVAAGFFKERERELRVSVCVMSVKMRKVNKNGVYIYIKQKYRVGLLLLEV